MLIITSLLLSPTVYFNIFQNIVSRTFSISIKSCRTHFKRSHTEGGNCSCSSPHFMCSLLGSSGFKARGKMFEVKSTSGKLLFSANEQEVVVGAERLRVMGE